MNIAFGIAWRFAFFFLLHFAFSIVFPFSMLLLLLSLLMFAFTYYYFFHYCLLLILLFFVVTCRRICLKLYSKDDCSNGPHGTLADWGYQAWPTWAVYSQILLTVTSRNRTCQASQVCLAYSCVQHCPMLTLFVCAVALSVQHRSTATPRSGTCQAWQACLACSCVQHRSTAASRSGKWDVSSATGMSRMLVCPTSFNADIRCVCVCVRACAFMSANCLRRIKQQCHNI